MQMKNLVAYPVAALVALSTGCSAAASDESGGASSAPQVTVTVPGPTVTATATESVPTPTVTNTVTVTVEPKAKSSFPGDGTYQVGVDIEPGTYVSGPPDRGNCYWARLSGSNGFGDILANNNSSGQSVVTIAKTDKFFESSGCSDWRQR